MSGSGPTPAPRRPPETARGGAPTRMLAKRIIPCLDVNEGRVVV